MIKGIKEECDLCGDTVSKIFILLAGSHGIVCHACAIGRRPEVLEKEWQMAEAYQQEYDAIEKANRES